MSISHWPIAHQEQSCYILHMARTEMQWESFRQLEWVLSFAQADLDSLDQDEVKRLGYELETFVRKAAGIGYTARSMRNTAKRLPLLQAGLRERLSDLAKMRPVRVVDRDGIKDSHWSSTFLPADGSIQLAAIEGDAYRQMVRSRKVEVLIYAAFASHIVASGIVGGQIRTCPECDRLFLLKLKPQPNREFHCSTPCTNRATFRRFNEKRVAQLLQQKEYFVKQLEKGDTQLMERVRAEVKKRRNQTPTKLPKT
jgi:hypothetical protein